jgi:uncharacterized protein
VLTGFFLLGVGMVGVFAVAFSSDHKTSGPVISAAPSAEPTDSPPTTTSAAVESSSPTETVPTTGSDISGGPQPVIALGDHPFNSPDAGAVQVPCGLPSFDTDVRSQDAFYRAVLPCLMAIWTPALRDSGLPLKTPSVVTTADDINSPCGTRPWNQTAMYCAGNHTIYMTARHYSEVERQTEPGAYLGQFVHEFGHALQGMIGINSAYGNAAYEAGGYGTPAGLELSRRSELQATCFGGMALAALQNGGLSDEYVDSALRDSAGRGDEYNKQPDHGRISTNKVWVEQGFYKNRVAQCNTWLATAAQVS